MRLSRLTVLADLAELGSTVEDIAHTLYDRGFRGETCAAKRCPIAVYLKACGLSPRTMVYETISDSCNGIFGLPTPNVVVLFIEAFDDGEYPELIA